MMDRFKWTEDEYDNTSAEFTDWAFQFMRIEGEVKQEQSERGSGSSEPGWHRIHR